jgi:hypothetical protein
MSNHKAKTPKTNQAKKVDLPKSKEDVGSAKVDNKSKIVANKSKKDSF